MDWTYVIAHHVFISKTASTYMYIEIYYGVYPIFTPDRTEKDGEVVNL